MPYVEFADVWKNIKAVEKPELRRLAEALTVAVSKSRANSTTTKYIWAYHRWKSWGGRHHETGFPVDTALFALYLQYGGESTGSHATVRAAVDVVAWIQRLAGVETVAHNELIKMIRDRWKRMAAKPKKKKEPITPEMLLSNVESFS